MIGEVGVLSLCHAGKRLGGRRDEKAEDTRPDLGTKRIERAWGGRVRGIRVGGIEEVLRGLGELVLPDILYLVSHHSYLIKGIYAVLTFSLMSSSMYPCF